ncbi:Aminotransferase-like, plant mobile domain [Sesbania bispinosa]|nr:Aminotransferase-like, plant mobile domain [Sesbania bispinosa]
MVKSRSAHYEPLLYDSSFSDVDTEDLSLEMIPKAISFASWAQLPHARVNPVGSSTQKWMTGCQSPTRPFTPAPSSGSSMLRSRLISGEFPWSTIHFMTQTTSTGCWLEWIDHVFANDAPFMDILSEVGVANTIRMSSCLGTLRRSEDLNCLVQRWSHTTHTIFTSWGEITPTLEDVHVLMKLPLFGDYDISSVPISNHLIEMAKELKVATIESAKYSRVFLAKHHSEPALVDSSSKTSPRKEFISPSVFLLACLLVEETHLPLASLFLGGFYGRLDQVQDQLFSSFGRFPINSFINLVFLQYYLFERFPEYAPVRTFPEPLPKGVNGPPEPRAWGWSMGRPRQSLLELIDDEDQFVQLPYVINLFPGVESLHRIYQEEAFSSRNHRSSRFEGVFDI